MWVMTETETETVAIVTFWYHKNFTIVMYTEQTEKHSNLPQFV